MIGRSTPVPLSAAPVTGPAWAALWLADLDEVPPGIEGALPHDEQERAQRFLRDVDRGRYLSCRAVLRALLVDQFDIAFGQPFESGAHGKPRIPGLSRGSFSLSHSGRHALIGVSHTHEIGVDIEEFRRMADTQAIARGQFSARERLVVDEQPDDDRASKAFLEVWTRKEACLKALGTGFSISGKDVDAGIPAPDSSVVRGPSNVGIRVASLWPAPNLAAAVAQIEER